MNREPTIIAALFGGLAFFAAGLFAPLSINLFALSLSFWMLPLIVVHLWPREARLGATLLILLFGGVALDVALGLRLGIYPFLIILLFGLTRPDIRAPETGELSLLARFASCLVALLIGCAVVTRDPAMALNLLPSALLTLLAYPLVLRALRQLGGPDLFAQGRTA